MKKMNNLAEINNSSEADNITPKGESILTKLGIVPSAIKSIKQRSKRSQYVAIINWLNETDAVKTQITALKPVEKYLNVLYHLHQLCVSKGENTYPQIKTILNTPIYPEPSRPNSSIPLYEYLILHGQTKELLEVCDNILCAFQNTENDLNEILILKARAFTVPNQKAEEAIELFEEIRSKCPENSQYYIEATARLAIHEINFGIYDKGMAKLNHSLSQIEALLKSPLDSDLRAKWDGLKTDLLERLGIYKMSLGQLQEAKVLYTELIAERKRTGMTHKLISALVLQGVLMKYLRHYDQAIAYLTEAKEKALAIDHELYLAWIDHHLAWVYLNQNEPFSLAEKLANSALEGYQKFDAQRGISDCEEQQGAIHFRKGDIDQAEKYFQQALNRRKSIGNLPGVGSSLRDLAHVSWRKKQYFKSTKWFVQAVHQHYKLGRLNEFRFYRILHQFYIRLFGKRNRNK
ncbi:MAG: hypothetical protein DRR16_29365 [Candidatus Parabeggiatoa sp. nov. 3]|nr:MAG: hypothetical protein DRR00_30610 [Gammaproteobacteria bacterium]RKZ56104.1 MAG: hypothetical protein DRQ99_29040 [Gammaproteobacteria bacterium]RKZ77578.1 MAG: hypothetical protein DRR16_29365 [Gammaproteobacteria bacterium]HEW97998.1 hypothetical protein [Beggiatoa sp.]